MPLIPLVPLVPLLQEEGRVLGGLLALRILARRYEFRDEEERVELIPVVTQVWT